MRLITGPHKPNWIPEKPVTPENKVLELSAQYEVLPFDVLRALKTLSTDYIAEIRGHLGDNAMYEIQRILRARKADHLDVNNLFFMNYGAGFSLPDHLHAHIMNWAIESDLFMLQNEIEQWESWHEYQADPIAYLMSYKTNWSKGEAI